MARPLRFQYPGAVHHVMARGDGGRMVFEDDDRMVFLKRLGETYGSCGWRVHVWVRMGNHFHLLLETPPPNLVAGMKWLLGVFSQGWNRARGRQGQVFQGRYKSVPVNGSDADRYYFRIVADCIHLTPARAGLAGVGCGKLAGYRWSSLSGYPTTPFFPALRSGHRLFQQVSLGVPRLCAQKPRGDTLTAAHRRTAAFRRAPCPWAVAGPGMDASATGGQPPFPRPPVRPNGSFRGLPQKANSLHLHLLGFDHTRLTVRHQGRDYRLTDVHGSVIRSIIA